MRPGRALGNLRLGAVRRVADRACKCVHGRRKTSGAQTSAIECRERCRRCGSNERRVAGPHAVAGEVFEVRPDDPALRSTEGDLSCADWSRAFGKRRREWRYAREGRRGQVRRA
eukprot:4774270-Pleurochrysis_carterae.AAC.1